MTRRPELAPLLSEDPLERREAIEELDLGDGPARFALRQVLLFDPDGGLRALCAERLGGVRGDDALPFVGPWLRDALGDPLPSVREAALRALGRLGDRESAPALRRAALEEPVWWARRAAVLALAAVGAEEELATLRAALGDPFWRVRHAATRALQVLLRERPALAEAILAQAPELGAAAQAALAYLRGEEAGAGLAAAEDDGWDRDPAVSTAQLLRSAADAATLPELLGHSHGPLREVAARRLAQGAGQRQLDALRRATRWLDEPRLPYGAEAARRLLDGLGAAAATLAAEALDGDLGDGAAAWACGWVVATGSAELHPRLLELARRGAAPLRHAAVAALAQLAPLPSAALIEALGDEDDAVRHEAALALCGDDSAAAQAALREVAYAQGLPPQLRCALLAAAERQGDRQRLREGAADPHPLCRSRALTALTRLGEASDAAAEDADPWIRAAVLRPETAAAALRVDPDAQVRRAALRCWQQALRQADRCDRPAAVVAGGTAGAAVAAAGAARDEVALAAATDPDPWIRAEACALLQRDGALALSAALRLSMDAAPMVRAAAADWLLANAPRQRLLALLQERDLSEDLRLAAWSQLAREPDEAMVQLLREALRSTDVGPTDTAQAATVQAATAQAATAQVTTAQARAAAGALREHLRALLLLFPDEALPAELRALLPTAAQRPARSARVPLAPASQRELRPLGRTGLRVAPLGLSGAFELPPAAYAAAVDEGVNLLFWEPRYHQLGRYLRGARRRRDELVIVAGTFHGDRRGIERDVDAALRRLRTDRLDVFLLFWARSDGRLDDDAFAVLADLKARGKIRTAGFSTHDRALALRAIEAQPFDVLMTRHSAAHPGAEAALLPAAQARGVGVITFSALCYGRLLRRPPGAPADAPLPSAADCYRYSLSQPGVSVCLSAPRRVRELRENLAALAQPSLAAPAQAALREHGARCRAEDRRFDALIRRPAAPPPLRVEAPAARSAQEPAPAMVPFAPPAGAGAPEPQAPPQATVHEPAPRPRAALLELLVEPWRDPAVPPSELYP